ncbi:hypothetical protein [Streptomyces sp. NPDC086182]|uniref:hypothetical protein n=1 Tax=Streptomyces sp. NPDC086182 TaxID=3155058 RepID=UPI00344222C1
MEERVVLRGCPATGCRLRPAEDHGRGGELTDDKLNGLLNDDERDAGWGSDGDYEWVR